MADYGNYYSLFRGWSLEEERIEIGDTLLILISKSINNSPIFVFFVFALICIATKLLAIKRMTPLICATIFIYISNIFIIHDLIQIRCAISAGLFLWAIKFKCDNKPILFWTVTLLAISFHYQAIVIVPLFFLSTNKLHKYLYLSLILVSYIMAFSGIGLAKFASLISSEGYATLFVHYASKDSNVNLFNIIQLLKISTFVLLLVNSNKLMIQNKYSTFLIKVYALSICSLPLFADISAVGFRVSEFFQIAEIFLLPMIAGIEGRMKYFYRMWYYGYAISIFLIDAFYNKYLVIQ